MVHEQTELAVDEGRIFIPLASLLALPSNHGYRGDELLRKAVPRLSSRDTEARLFAHPPET